MSVAGPLGEVVGAGIRGAHYDIADTEVAAGSTLGAPKCVCVVKATGAIEKVFSSDYGKAALGTVVVHHWDASTGIPLKAQPGTFRIHPEHQEHWFSLSNGIVVHEDIFVLSRSPDRAQSDPPAVYLTLTLSNPTARRIEMDSYVFAQLRGETGRDVESSVDKRRNAIVAWNSSDPSFARVLAASEPFTSWETSMDHAKAIAGRSPGVLSNRAASPSPDPLGALHFNHALRPGAQLQLTFTCTFALSGARDALRVLRRLPEASEALHATRLHYHEVLNRSVVLTPQREVNAGVLWAKANMLRTMLFAPTGWCLVNDPTRSNNSVGRDTAWFAFGADYIAPDFAEASLLWYAGHLERKGLVVEYYDIRTGKTADYGLNINDNTPLLILALWHHFNTTADIGFLERVYRPAVKAAKYILSQRNEDGLVWCTATGEADRGIAGWRNVIKNYRLSGATTELNSECYAALLTLSHMARVLGKHKDGVRFKADAEALRAAVNERLMDPETGLYYLNIELDGTPRTDITCDMIFPVMFGVADEATAARVVARLSADEFWTDAGMRTVPRNAVNYGPTHGYGLLGGVWVGVAFWYAFAAARVGSEFMASALSNGFHHYAKDPLRNNTVPGQFSEWLHGETLVNQGMMLSPWFPPRYLWAAIEGAAGLDLSGSAPTINVRLPARWKWAGVRDLMLAATKVTWFIARVPEVRLYTNATLRSDGDSIYFREDISSAITIEGDAAVGLALRDGANIAIFIGNTSEIVITTAVGIAGLRGSFAVRHFYSLFGEWRDAPSLGAEQLRRGVPVELDSQGFCLLELRQDA